LQGFRALDFLTALFERREGEALERREGEALERREGEALEGGTLRHLPVERFLT